MPSLRIKCYGVTVLQPINVQKSKLISAICGYSEVTVKFNQCNTDVTKVTEHSQYAKFKNQMLRCYSVTSLPRAESQEKYVMYHKFILLYSESAIVVSLV